MRARKRFKPMTFNVGEPELYEHAQKTRFDTLVDDIHADPTGRGRAPATSPLMAYSSANASQINAAQEQALGELRAKRTGGNPNDPEAGDLAPIEDLSFPPQGQSPVGLLSGGRAYKRPAPEVPAWEQGDNEAIPGLEFPPDASAQTMAPIEAAANAGPTKPDYGRIAAEKVKAGSAGPAPEGGDKALAALRGVGSILQSAGGRADLGMKSGLDAYAHYQDQERELREHGARQAELDTQAAKEQRGENRYSNETNYNRMRDEGQDFRLAQNDAADREHTQFTRGLLEGDRAYERDPARRQEELDTYRGKKQIDAEFARRRGTGTGGGQANRDAAYRAMMDSASELYPNGVPQNVANEIALRAMDKDPTKAAASFIDGIRGETQAQGNKEASMEQQRAALAQRGRKAEEAANAVESELSDLETRLTRRKENHLPGQGTFGETGPAVAGFVKRAEDLLPRHDAFKAPAARGERETDKEYQARLDAHAQTATGPTGYTEDEAIINSGGNILARAQYALRTNNSANMAQERADADAWIRTNGTTQGMLNRIRQLRDEIKRRKAEGTLLADDAELAAIGSPDSGAAPPPPPGFQLEN